MKQRRINVTLTIVALTLTALLILTTLPRASTAAPRLQRQPPGSTTALNSSETTESSAPALASVVQSPGTTASVSAALRSSAVMFIENVGQFDDRACFQVRGGTGTMWLAEDAIWITVLEKPSSPQPPSPNLREGGVALPSPKLGRGAGGEGQPRKGVNLCLSFPGSNPHPHLAPFNRLDTVVSYFIGSDPDQWHPDVPVWGGVRYKDLYPGVDLEVTSEGGHWTWRLAIRDSQFAISDARLRVEGADGLALEGERLHLTTTVGDFTLPLLAVEGLNVERASVERANNQTFEVISPFSSAPRLPSSSAPLQDNPSDLLYSTFLGGSDDDQGVDIAVDGSGAAYVTGYTESSDFPTTPGAFDTTHNGGRDAYVVKLNAGGTGLVYITFLGGSDSDAGYGITLDGAGSAYVTGYTSSYDFPTTPGAFDTSLDGGGDAFVVKLNAGGTGLVYTTFLGGESFYELGSAIAVDRAGSAYVTGYISSPDFPTTPGAFDTTCNGLDAFVAKLNPTGTGLEYATFLGGSSGDSGNAITLDGAGNAYVTGATKSVDFPTTPGAFDTTYNDPDAFVAKLNSSGTGLEYATFLGGNSSGSDIATDGAGSAYVTGWTQSSEFPTTAGAFDTSYNGGDYDVFVVKVNPGGTGLDYATFLGGSYNDSGCNIAMDGSGNAYIYGSTESSDFPAANGPGYDTSHNGDYDAFVVKLNASGTDLAYATFLGGGSKDSSYAIALDGTGSVYATGRTSSSDFPTTPGAFDTSYNGEEDVFVAKLGPAGPEPAPDWSVYTPLNSGLPSSPQSIAMDEDGNAWIGTFNGLVKFDGTNWTIYHVSNPRFPNGCSHCDWVSSIVVDSGGTIWSAVGYLEEDGSHYSKALAKFDGLNWTIFDVYNSGLPGMVNSIAIDASGNKWIGTHGYGLVKFDDTNWAVYNTSNSGLHTNYLTSGLAIDSDGNLWIGTQYGVAKYDGSNWNTYDLPGNLDYYPGSVTSIAIDKSGNKWFGTAAGLTKFDGNTWTVYDSTNVLPGDWVTSIAIDANNNKWVGITPSNSIWHGNTGGGLAKFDGTSWSIFTQSNSGLPDDSVLVVTAAKNNDIWVGTDGTNIALAIYKQVTDVPEVTTLPASGATLTSATLNGEVNPNGLDTSAWFEWGEDSNLLTFSSTPEQTIGAGTEPVEVTATLTGLELGRTYYYRIVARNQAGTSGRTIENIKNLTILLGSNPGNPNWNKYDCIIYSYAVDNAIPPALLKALLVQESSLNERAFRYEPKDIKTKREYEDYWLPDHPPNSIDKYPRRRNPVEPWNSATEPVLIPSEISIERLWEDYHRLISMTPYPPFLSIRQAQWRVSSSYGLGQLLYCCHGEKIEWGEPETFYDPYINTRSAVQHLVWLRDTSGRGKTKCDRDFDDFSLDGFSKAILAYNMGHGICGCSNLGCVRGLRPQEHWWCGNVPCHLQKIKNYVSQTQPIVVPNADTSGILPPLSSLKIAVGLAPLMFPAPGEYEMDRLVADLKGTGQPQLAVLYAVVDPEVGPTEGVLKVFTDVAGSALEWQGPAMPGILPAGTVYTQTLSIGGPPLLAASWGVGAHGTVLFLFRWDGQTFRAVPVIEAGGEEVYSLFGDAGVLVTEMGLVVDDRDADEPLNVTIVTHYAWNEETEAFSYEDQQVIRNIPYQLYLPLILRSY